MTVVTQIEEIKIGDIIKLDYQNSHWYIVECFEVPEKINTFLGPQRRCHLVDSNDPITKHGEYFTIHKGWFNAFLSTFTVLNR